MREKRVGQLYWHGNLGLENLISFEIPCVFLSDFS